MSIVDNRLSVINCQLSVIMKRYVFIAALYAVSFSALSPAHAQSPYISRVWEYCPAPGQFVNELPEYEDGDDADSTAKPESIFAVRLAAILPSEGGEDT